jgi:hypothetical protein
VAAEGSCAVVYDDIPKVYFFKTACAGVVFFLRGAQGPGGVFTNSASSRSLFSFSFTLALIWCRSAQKHQISQQTNQSRKFEVGGGRHLDVVMYGVVVDENDLL